ncbi:MAG TPA: sodium-independent anion transporter [Hydrogenophaga sp.]|uniref:SulP family inorganic anion transporter n=1 Tax=Hydrogenophaga sp. TaxID=1904254 RepID=UPI0008B0DFB6|nr:SulP family inorganic anion transporter [Hydrogenophaga sp.]OGA74105.1 MAG: sodium-independent anion transporter [Burkholderiales bacterium GWE1_65_30]OGA90058.1 MAG: sodium-independent anion transporter [Burkholderiales bacterium GWF1_66_17]OGB35976.1 MAG: sodium-independent anion transporter [Burkholderiales bacterium RIFCSPLOWO2_02_FULL_66_35]HAX18801.1 sodium-independent anion transporter [Hydrogenophaga sp.]HBU16785.1 sodium-independent anion transporter [Hydrogenophaga sp.]
MLKNLPPLAPFRPRLLNDLKGYNGEKLVKDMGAGATVGIVALPLAMAFAIASGLKPEAGLWTAIIAGFLISALGGTSVQIGGPAGAFIVIVYGIVERYGVANLLIATASAGVLLFLLGLFRLGNLVRYVPVSVVIGFTNGIAVLIGLSQVRDWLGLDIAKMPGDFFGQIGALSQHLHSFNAYAFGLGALCVIGLFIWPRLWAVDSQFRRQLDQIDTVSALKATSRLPAPVVALVTLSLLAWALSMPVETIGSRFGGIPQGVPAFELPDFSWETVRLLVTPTLTIAILGAIESLLCARVADQLSDTPKHDPNQELMAQGVANVVVPFFGGMPATGTIARTVTNIRSGAVSPVAGIVHSATLAAVVLIAAPLAAHIPLAVLAGVLLFVAWNMGEWREFGRLKQFTNHYRLMMVSTFLVTIIFDLTVAVELGLVMACFLFVRRQSDIFRADPLASNQHQLTYRLYGSLFFGAVAKIDPIVNAVEQGPAGLNVMLDATQLISLDTTGLDALEQLHKAVAKRGGHLGMVGVNPQPRSLIERSGFAAHLHTFH